MERKLHCENCTSTYKIVWNESTLVQYQDEDADLDELVEEEELEPVYCPFCGSDIECYECED